MKLRTGNKRAKLKQRIRARVASYIFDMSRTPRKGKLRDRANSGFVRRMLARENIHKRRSRRLERKRRT